MHRNFVYLVRAGFNWKRGLTGYEIPNKSRKRKSRISHEFFLQFGSDALELPLKT